MPALPLLLIITLVALITGIISPNSLDQKTLSIGFETPAPSATASAKPTFTSTASASIHPRETLKKDLKPTPTPAPLVSSQEHVENTPEVKVTSGQLCPAGVHDSYKVQGPDGNYYSTWHPQRDPSGCYFDHEHGDDPRTSQANPNQPPFGYVAHISGMDEPHNGFKVFVVNAGTTNDEGRTATVNSRIVAHMGTGGTKRFSTEFHSLMYDLTSPDGHFVHVSGMADTGGVGSICSNPRQGKTVVLVPGMGCPVQSLYEIWLFSLKIGDKVTALASTAVFDPISVMNPSNQDELKLTDSFFSGSHRGCVQEAYHGPVYWYNSGGSTTYYTDAYGKIASGGPLKQEISAHSDIGIKMNQDQSQFKYKRSKCGAGIDIKN